MTKSAQAKARTAFRKYANSVLSPPTMSDQCVADYAISSVDPFNESLRPCIPMFPAVPSDKTKSRIREYAGRTSGTTGAGFVVLRSAPFTDQHNTFFSSGADFDLDHIPTDFANVGTSLGSPSVGHPSAILAPGKAEYRMVSQGIRVCFSDVQDHAGGQIYIGHHDTGASLLGAGTPEIMDLPGKWDGKWISGDPASPENLWYSALWAPSLGSDFQYKSEPPAVNNFNTAILIRGPVVPGGIGFRIQVCEHAEWVGDLMPRGTPSHVDSGKTEKMLANIQNMEPEHGVFASNGGQWMLNAIQSMVSPGLNLASGYLSDLLQSGLPSQVGGMGVVVEDLGELVPTELGGMFEALTPIIEEAPMLALML